MPFASYREDPLKSLAAAVHDMKVYKVSKFNHSCDFMTADCDAEPDNGKVRLKEFDERETCGEEEVAA